MHSETSQSPTTNCYLWQRQAYHPAAPSTRGGGSTGNPNIGIQWRFENDPRDVFPMNFEDKLLWYHVISLDITWYLNIFERQNMHKSTSYSYFWVSITCFWRHLWHMRFLWLPACDRPTAKRNPQATERPFRVRPCLSCHLNHLKLR